MDRDIQINRALILITLGLVLQNSVFLMDINSKIYSEFSPPFNFFQFIFGSAIVLYGIWLLVMKRK